MICKAPGAEGVDGSHGFLICRGACFRSRNTLCSPSAGVCGGSSSSNGSPVRGSCHRGAEFWRGQRLSVHEWNLCCFSGTRTLMCLYLYFVLKSISVFACAAVCIGEVNLKNQ